MKKRRSAFLLEKLEPRLLFSADLALLPLDGAFLAADQDVLLTAPAQLSGDSEQVSESVEQVQREVIFIDSGIEDYQQLLDDIQAQAAEGRQFETVILDSNRDGIAQISDYLSSQQDISAVHILSHGSDGEAVLGNSPLNLSTLDSYADAIEGWQKSLTDQADLLFYGCNLASGEEGLTLINSLSLLTGADVAASDDATGAAALGGDWELEQAVGEIETAVAISTDVQQDWQGLLATLTVTTTDDVVDGDTSSINNLLLDNGGDNFISLREAIIATNSDIGADTIFLDAATYTITNINLGDDAGDFDIRDDLSIVGISPSSTIIDGNNLSSVFEVHDDAAITVSFSNLKIQDGFSNDAAGANGAGLFIAGSADTPDVYVYINNLWFSGNNTSGDADMGGAISNEANLTITNTLIEGNTSGEGGGVWNGPTGVLTMENVTLSGNEATSGDGGGFFNEGDATLRHVTITNNTASGAGGGVIHDNGAISTDIGNSIIAGNTASSSPDITSTIGTITSSGSNIIQDATGASGFGVPETGIDPLLGALADNGGNLMTHAPAAAELIDTADRTMMPTTDQRGFLRSDGLPDIGAYEVGASVAATADYLDQFNALAYDGDDGALPWSNDWQEIGESDGAFYSGPGVSVYNHGVWGQGLYLYNAPIGVWREVDLSGAETATLSFDWAALGLGASDSITVEISTDGGINWEVIDTFGSDSALQSVSYDISAYIDSDTRIKFESTVLNGEFFVDNVQITLGTAASPVDNPATFSGDTAYSGNEGDTGSGVLVANDPDGLSDGSYFTIKTQGTFGSASIDSGTGVWSYTPSNLDWSGSDSFTVTVTDDLGGTTDQLITVDLAPVNDVPTMSVNTLTISQGETVTLNNTMLAAADVDNSPAELALTVSNVTNGYFAFGSDTITPITSFTQDDIDNSLVVFVHDGGELAPTYSINVSDGSATSADLATTVIFTDTTDGVIWLSTEGDVVSGGQPGTDSWGMDSLVQVADPNMSFAPATTNGTFSVAFDLSHFGSNKNIAAVHYVTTDIQIGTTNFQLKSGDVLFSVLDTNLVGNSSAPESGFSNALTVKKDDVIVFRPDSSGDYSVGSFALLLDEPLGTANEIWGMTLIEHDTFVGDITLGSGNFLFSCKNSKNDILLYTTAGIGAATPSAVDNPSEVLLEGSDLGVRIDNQIYGLDLIEKTLTVGGQTLSPGTILVSVDSAEGITTDEAFAVTEFDIFALDVQNTTLGSGSGLVTASLFFDGSDLSFDESKISGFTLTVEGTSTNTSPILAAIGNQSIDELTELAFSASASDSDDPANTLTFSLDATSLAAGMTITADGDFSWTPTETQTGAHTVTITVTDDGSPNLSDSETFTIRVNDVPTMSVNTLTISQGETVTLNNTMLAAADVDNSPAELALTVSNVTNGYFAFGSDTTTPITSFTQDDIDNSLVVFVHDGGELAPSYSINVSDGSATSADLAATVTFAGTADGVIWLSMDGDEGTASGIPGVDSVDLLKEHVLQMANPDFALGETTTNGTFSIAFDISNFGTDANINGLHYVTSDVVIGGTNPITLQKGDLLLTSADDNKTMVSNGAGAPAGLNVDKGDIFFFRPDQLGDYSVGNFYLLLTNPAGADINALTLVEKDVWVGDRWLHEGDILFSRSGGAEDNDIWLLETGTINPSSIVPYPTLQLIEGDDISLTDQIYGLDILEDATTIGGKNYDAGTLLFSINADDTGTGADDGIGTNMQEVTQYDIAALTVNQTTLVSVTAQVDATIMFDGSTVNFDSGSEMLDGFTLTVEVSPTNAAPTLINNNIAVVEGQTTTLTNGMLLATDPDDADDGLVFTIVTVDGGQFEFSSNPGVAVTSFDQGQITAGEILFVDDGDENAPTFSFEVTDGLNVTSIFTGGVNFANVNDVPTISAIGDQTIDEDNSTGALGFSVSDIETAVTVTASSSDTALIPNGNLSLVDLGSGNWTIDATPAANMNGGPVTITVTVDDGTTTTDATFTVSVTAINDVPTISAITNQTIDEDSSTGALAFTVSDIETAVGSLTVTASSSDTALIPNGNLSLVDLGSGNWTIDATPAANMNGGPVTITVTVDDGTTTTDATFTVSITAINDVPTISAIGDQTIDEDSSTAVLGFSVSDIETAVTVTASSSDTALIPNGNLSLVDLGSGDWTIEATPAANMNGGPVTITVTVDDGTTTTDATFTVSVTAINDVPTISAITNQTIDEDSSTGALAFTVSDIETAVGSLTVTASSSDTALIPNGNLSLVDLGSGNWTIDATPAANMNGGPVTITVTVDDGTTTTDATFTVSVTAINDAPTISAILDQTIDEDNSTGALGFSVSDIETAVTVTASSSDTALIPNGNLSLVDLGSGDWTIEATPAANMNGGPVTITVTVDDGTTTTDATFTVSITAINDVPTISAIGDQTIDEDSSTAVLGFSVSDIETAVTVTASSSDTALIPNGNLSLVDLGSGDWTIEATPAANMNGGPVTITVTVDDGTTTTDATFTVSVTAINDVPTISAITNQTIDEDSSTGALGFSVSDIETAAGSLTVTASSSDTAIIPDGNLTLVDLGGGDWTIAATPAANMNGGPVTITVTVNDGTTTTDETFTVSVTAINDVPTISTITDQTINEDSSTAALGFSVSDIETAVDSLTVTASSSDTAIIPDGNLTLVDLGGGDWTIAATPAANMNGGPVTITVTVNDGTTTTDETFTVSVTAINDVPTISTITDQTINEDSSTAALGFSVSDIETAVDSLTVTASSSDTAIIPDGNLTLVDLGGGDWTIAATPAANMNGGPVTITVTVNDGTTTTDETFTVSVTAINDVPIITSTAPVTVDEDSSYTYTMTVDDADSADILNLSAPTLPGWLNFNTTTGVLSGTPSNAEVGDHLIVLRVNDGTVDVDQSFTITVNEVNDAPTVVNDNLSVTEDHTLTVTTIADLLNNDSDPEGDHLTLSGFTLPGHGALIDNGDGTLTYMPDSNHTGTDSFNYTVSDGNGGTASGTAFIYVAPVGDTPQVMDATVLQGEQSDPITISRHAADGAEVTHFRISTISGGTLYLADGSTQVNNGDYVSVAQGQSGLRFTPSVAAIEGTFQVESSEDGVTVAAQSGRAISTISVTVLPATSIPETDVTPEVEDSVEDIVEEDSTEEETEVEEETTEVVETQAEPQVPLKEDSNTNADSGKNNTRNSLTNPILSFIQNIGSANDNDSSLDNRGPSTLQALNVFLETTPIETLRNAWDSLDIGTLSARDYNLVRSSFDALQQEVAQENRIETAVVSSAIATTMGLSAGYVVWMLKGGSLLASLLSSMPAWHLADPLSILGSGKLNDDDDESLESIIKKGEKKEENQDDDE